MTWKIKTGSRIHQSQNGIQVFQNFFYRWLTFNSDAIQTLINRRQPYSPGLSYIDPLSFGIRLKPMDCCLLGLGGGGVPHALNPYLNAHRIYAVENNAEIIEIAQTYFMIDRIKSLHILHQDAQEFVKYCDQRFGYLMIDLFNAHAFPEHCNTYDFFLQCQKLLFPDGILAINLTNLREQWSLYRFIHSIFNQRTVLLPTPKSTNTILFACNGLTVTPLLELLKKNRRVTQLSWQPRWGYVAEMNQWR